MQSERSRKIGYSRHASRVFLRRDFAALPDVLRSRDFASLNNDNDNDTGYGCGARLGSLTRRKGTRPDSDPDSDLDGRKRLSPFPYKGFVPISYLRNPISHNALRCTYIPSTISHLLHRLAVLAIFYILYPSGGAASFNLGLKLFGRGVSLL